MQGSTEGRYSPFYKNLIKKMGFPALFFRHMLYFMTENIGRQRIKDEQI